MNLKWNLVKGAKKTKRLYEKNIKILPIIGFLLWNTNISSAAPINNLEEGVTTGGVTFGSHGSNIYVESKPNDDFTAGVQYNNWNTLGMIDVYGQFNIANSPLRAIIGNRNFNNVSSSRIYVGAAISKEVSSDWVGYTSLIAGDGFQELQLGTTYKITDNYGLVFNYRNLRYEGSKNDMNIGLMFNF